MDHNGVEAHVLHENDVEGKVLFEPFIHHGMTAILDHNGSFAEPPDVWQRFNQNLGSVFLVNRH